MDLCNIDDIRLLLARHGFRFQKSLGQNFLCDASVLEEIAESADITKETCVLEIGPGIGALSRELCARAKKVVAIELDRRLPEILSETMADCPNFTLVQGDVLRLDLNDLCNKEFGSARAVVCANLPYYITTPALQAFVSCKRFSAVTVLIQKEAAARIAADAGTSEYGAFILWVRYHMEAEILLDVPRDRFIPAPNVDSAVIRLTRRAAPPVEADEESLFKLIRAAFAQRRKTLSNALSSAYNGKITKIQIQELLKSLGFSENVRGEALTLTEFSHLSLNLNKYLSGN